MLNMSRVLFGSLPRNGPGLACGSAIPEGCRKKDGGQARFLDQGFGLFKMRVILDAVAAGGGCDRVPNVAPAPRLKFRRFDHSDHRIVGGSGCDWASVVSKRKVKEGCVTWPTTTSFPFSLTHTRAPAMLMARVVPLPDRVIRFDQWPFSGVVRVVIPQPAGALVGPVA